MEQSEGQSSPQAVTHCRHPTSLPESLPSAAIVIATRDRPAQLAKALEAVLAQDYPRSQTVVVDNAPSDERTHGVVQRFQVTYAVEPVPGLGRARNTGARATVSDFILFLDDDAVPQPGWVRALVREFADERVGVVTGRILPWPGSAESAQATFIRGGSIDGHFGERERMVITRQSADWVARSAFGGLGLGANMAFRRSVLERIGGFDPLLGPGAPLLNSDDYYAFFRAVAAGAHAIYTPDAVVNHPYQPRTDDFVQRYLISRTAASAFVALLLARHPEHAPAILQYIGRRLSGRPSPWGRPGLLTRPPGVGRGQALKAVLAGPILYFRRRLF